MKRASKGMVREHRMNSLKGMRRYIFERKKQTKGMRR